MLELLEFGLVHKYEFSAAITVTGYLIVILSGYLLGSLNAGIIISKLAYRDDIRNHGSGGAGATNMLRTYGKSAAALTFFFDGFKTVIAVFIGIIFFGSSSDLVGVEGSMGLYVGIYVGLYAGPYIGGLAAIIGHAFPVYYKFKGGKSVAATFFMVLCTEPVVAVACLLIFIAVVWWTKYVSVGSVMSVVVYPLILNRATGMGTHNLIAIFIMLLVAFLHRENIKRVWAGKENKISFKSKKKNKAGAEEPVPSQEEEEE